MLKFRYDQVFPQERWWSLFKLRLHAFPAVFEIPAAEAAESYHFEVVAPDGVDFTEGTLITAPALTETSCIDHVGGGVPRIHLRTAKVPRRSRAIAQASLRVSRRGWLGAAAMCALVMFITLIAGGIWVHSTFTSTLKKVDPSVGNQAAALLVVVPAIFATLLVRPQEHAMAARLLRVVKPLLVLASLASYAAASLLILGPHDASLPPLWDKLMLVAGFAAAIISLNWVLPTIKKRRS